MSPMSRPHPRVIVAVGAVWSGALLAACGSGTTTVTVASVTTVTAASQSSTNSSLPTAATTVAPTPRPELLFAVVESHSTNYPQPGAVDDTVAVVGLDGIARSKATFAPRTPPQIGNAAPILSADAHVAAGQVFYIDGAGVVRALGAPKGSTPSRVTTFAAPSPQGYESFAVSPDGKHLIAAIDALTPFQTPDPNDPNNPFGSGGAQDHDTIQAADAGAGARTLYTLAHPDKPLFVGGWDSVSPIGLTDPPLGTQSNLPQGWGSHAVRLDTGGHPARAYGPASCLAIEGLLDGTALCAGSTTSSGTPTEVASVHGPTAGDWTVPIPSGFYVTQDTYGDGPHLSPDGGTVVFALVSATTNGSAAMYTMTKGGAPHKLIDGFRPEGFLDADTVIGQQGAGGNLGLVHLSGGGVTDLGFRGLFVGVVQQAG
jgi:hypothetical protein